MDEDNLYFNREAAKRRRSYILYDVDRFINSDNDILLIKGQINDLRNTRGNTANYFLEKYGNMKDIQIENIFLLLEEMTVMILLVLKREREKQFLLFMISQKRGMNSEKLTTIFGFG